MQILKGNNGKSVTVHHLLNSTNSICFVYDTGWTPSFECYMIDNNETSIEELKQGILEQISQLKLSEYQLFTYLIIYTNNNENELLDLISWLNKNKTQLRAIDVLVTCK